MGNDIMDHVIMSNLWDPQWEKDGSMALCSALAETKDSSWP